MLRRFSIAAWAATALVAAALACATPAHADDAAAAKGEHLQVRLVAEQTSTTGGATLATTIGELLPGRFDVGHMEGSGA